LGEKPDLAETESRRFSGHDAWALLALLLLAVAALWPVLNVAPDIAPGLPDLDARTQWYPWRLFGFASLLKGGVPLWNPSVLCGTPFLGNFQSALFYPPNLMFAFMGVAKAARASLVLHLWLSMLFTYLLVRMFRVGRPAAIIGAAAFGLCAAQLLRVPAGHWGVSCAIPWLPLALIAAERIMRKPDLPGLFLGGAAIALQVLSGVPQIVFITAIAVGIYALLRGFGEGLPWRGRVGRWAAVAGFFLLGAGLSAPQLIPGIEAALHGARGLPMRREWIEQFSLGPENLATLFLPGFFGGMKNGFYWGRFFYWEMNMYVGVGALALALTGLAAALPRRRAGRFGLLAAAMLLLAFGKHTPLMGLLTALPFGDMLRGPAKFILPFSLALSVLAAMGADAALRPGRARNLLSALAGTAVVVLLLALGARWHLAGWQDVLYHANECLYAPTRNATRAELLPMTVSAIQSLAILAALAAALLLFRRNPKVLPLMVALVICLDGVFFARAFIGPWTTFRADGSAWPEGAAGALRDLGGDYRTLAMNIPEMDDAIIERVPTIEGIEPNPPRRFHILFRSGQEMPIDVAPSVYQAYGSAPEFMRMGLGRVLGPVPTNDTDGNTDNGTDGKTDNGMAVLWRDEAWKLSRLPDAVPRARIVYDAARASSEREAFSLLFRTDPSASVILEEGLQPPAGGVPAERTAARIVEEGPDRVTISAELERPGWLVLLDNHYPGWRAEAGGEPLPILRADFAFRAVPLPAGKHEVVFTYRPASLRYGIGLAALSVLVCVGLMAGRRRRAAKP
jgi:hypothetical protein